jgi:PAS domain S-box-containing protein
MKQNNKNQKLTNLEAENGVFLPLILETTFDAVLISHEDGSLWYASSNTPSAFGIDQEKIDQTDNVSSLFGEDFFNLEKLKKRGRIDNLECRIRKSDGENRTLLVNLRWTERREGMILFCCRDITEIKKADQVLRNDARMKDEFISMAGHELRTPLTTVQGYAELLLQQPDIDAETRLRSLALIFEKAQELAKITSDLLDLCQDQDNQRLNLRYSVVDAQGLVERVISKFGQKIPSQRLKKRLPESPAYLLVDETGVERVLEKLLDNAVKYSPAQGLITVCGQEKEKKFLFLIEDEGIGMTPEQRDKVFDKFYRADGSDSAIPGLGLGMSVARKIVEEHGGRIWIESTPGKGTRIYFTVPMIAAIPVVGKHPAHGCLSYHEKQ